MTVWTGIPSAVRTMRIYVTDTLNIDELHMSLRSLWYLRSYRPNIFMFVLWMYMWGFAKSESAGRNPAGLSGRKMWNPGLRQLRGRVGPTRLARKPSMT